MLTDDKKLLHSVDVHQISIMCDVLDLSKDEVNQPKCDSQLLDDYDDIQLKLYDLPIEIILKICTYLDPDFIQNNLSKVCVRFAEILEDVLIWKAWVKSRATNKFPVIHDLSVFENEALNWREHSVHMCKEYKKWSQVEKTMRHVVVKDVHFASVDTILLVNNGQICVSGGRDRSMSLFHVLSVNPHSESHNVSQMKMATTKQNTRMNAHQGWVWDLAADDLCNTRKVYSASWDNSVKEWDLNEGLTCLNTFNCRMSALSLAHVDHTIFTGLYSKTVLTFDPRSGPNAVGSYKAHRGPVLALQTHKAMVASVSEDRSLVVWDRVAGKVLKSESAIPFRHAYPTCLSWSETALYVGDSKGSLHCVHPETLSYVKSHELWPQPKPTEAPAKVIGCHQHLGCLIVCSENGEIKFLYDCYPPVEFSSLKSSTYEITEMQYRNGILAVGTCGLAVEFWASGEMFDQYNASTA